MKSRFRILKDWGYQEERRPDYIPVKEWVENYLHRRKVKS